MSDQIRLSTLGLFFLIVAMNIETDDWVRLAGIALSIFLITLASRAGRKAEHEEVMRRGSSIVR